ncbi:hypothetical protein NGI46_07240 [Peribacillus butanolivorans]|uniref:hypothetical protein n=1 Tax=Peribacillus butanolivorans TaxID=421767 RepID=UPI00207C9055|nr:hypothetical protein [Peribacillus butanolivorans]MCO0597262.1 hypothetical protein [Peribacillus butanolivorans]
MKTLNELVNIYRRNYSKDEEWRLSDFRKSSKFLEELIIDAVWGRGPRLERDSHQFRIPKKVLEEMVDLLVYPIIMEELKGVSVSMVYLQLFMC